MAKYYYIWHKAGTTTRRKFTFSLSLVPDKYRMSLKTAEPWAKKYLGAKYGIPASKVIITENGGLR